MPKVNQEAERSRADTSKRCAGGEEVGFPLGGSVVPSDIGWLDAEMS